MSEKPLKIAVILGSVRDGRFGPVVAKWFAGRVEDHGGAEVDLIDLADYPLPLQMPQMGQPPAPEVGKVWWQLSQRLLAADAFVVVTAEYNHGIPASLKNAIDWYKEEWVAKPVALVSYGGMGGGLRAAEHLRHVFAELHAVTVRDMLSFHNAWGDFFADGAVVSPPGSEEAAKRLLDQLIWWAEALRTAREAQPYPQ
jgi:NAD(P)H-dependent FMN reductase